jgi:hypothetical protein
MAWALPVARLRNIKGVVQVRPVRTTRFVTVGKHQAIHFGDIIRTGKNGRADVLFTNGVRVPLRESSHLEIVKPASATQPMVIRMWGKFKKVLQIPRNSRIRPVPAGAKSQIPRLEPLERF